MKNKKWSKKIVKIRNRNEKIKMKNKNGSEKIVKIINWNEKSINIIF